VACGLLPPGAAGSWRAAGGQLGRAALLLLGSQQLEGALLLSDELGWEGVQQVWLCVQETARAPLLLLLLLLLLLHLLLLHLLVLLLLHFLLLLPPQPLLLGDHVCREAIHRPRAQLGAGLLLLRRRRAQGCSQQRIKTVGVAVVAVGCGRALRCGCGGDQRAPAAVCDRPGGLGGRRAAASLPGGACGGLPGGWLRAGGWVGAALGGVGRRARRRAAPAAPLCLLQSLPQALLLGKLRGGEPQLGGGRRRVRVGQGGGGGRLVRRPAAGAVSGGSVGVMGLLLLLA
jgi:hypothetical protein